MSSQTDEPSSSIPEIAVVVATYQRPEGVRRLLEALAKQTLPLDQWELVLVDDCSDEATVAQIDLLATETPVQVRVLYGRTNQGPAVTRNLGWRSTGARLLAFTDDDCQPDPGWLEAGCACLDADPRIGVAQGRTIRPPGSDDYPYSCFTVVREVLSPSPWFEGCNLFLRRRALEEGGGFDESLGFVARGGRGRGGGGEETSLGWAVLEAGWERAWAQDAVVVHELAERPWRWHVQIHYQERNIVRLAARYPQMRSAFWRPWAVKRENALFAFAVVGVLVSTRRRSGLFLSLPYLRWLLPPDRPPMGWKAALHQVSAHGASLAGKLAEGIKRRILIL